MRRLAIALAALAAIISCRGGKAERAFTAETGGQAARGAALIEAKGCGACHTIPGIRGAEGVVAAPLTTFARRTFIAGELPNTPENLVRWVRDPRSVEPHTAMPAVGLTDQQARDIAAYLYELR